MKRWLFFVAGTVFCWSFGDIGSAQTVIDPIATIHIQKELICETASTKNIIPMAARASDPLWIGIVIGKDRIVATVPNRDIGRGLAVIFTVPMRMGFDTFMLGHREVRATVIKTDSNLGLMLLAAETPAEVSCPGFAERTNPTGAIRWPVIHGNDFPREYIEGNFSERFGDGATGFPRMVPGTPIFDRASRRLIGIAVEKKNSPAIVPIEEVKQFIDWWSHWGSK